MTEAEVLAEWLRFEVATEGGRPTVLHLQPREFYELRRDLHELHAVDPTHPFNLTVVVERGPGPAWWLA